MSDDRVTGILDGSNRQSPGRQLSAVMGRHIVRTLRQVYSFGVENRLVTVDPAKKVKAPKPIRGEKILPLTIEEIDRAADEAREC